jgi:transposase InsO family protein
MISPEDRRTAVDLIREAVASGARKRKACEVVEISVRTCRRWERDGIVDRRKGSVKTVVRKLAPEERQEIIDVSCEKRFRDLSPHHIVPILAEEGRYIASESTFYRVLRSKYMVNHRENSRQCRAAGKPLELVATGPNQVWSWDITWLKSEVRGLYYYCYMIKDIWKKDIVGWEIHEEESVEVAAAMFRRLKLKRNLRGVHLHSDNGNPMKGSTMIVTLYNLGVIPSFSRPRVSDDNPYIESLFKTMKYTAGYPGVFKSLDHAREWMAGFVNWYNTEHRHSAIGYVTPAQRGSGVDLEIYKRRNQVIEAARAEHPERWVNGVRKWNRKDVIVLNPKKEQSSNAA